MALEEVVRGSDFAKSEEPMPDRTGADCVVDALVEQGVNTVFSLSGNQIMSIYDATIDRDLDLIHTRHEAAAVHMADAVGRLTGTPGVALLPAGPGHCNAVTALYVAKMAESPVVVLSGHAPLSQLGAGAFQEIDQVMTARPVAKAAWLVEDDVATHLDRAFDVAQSGRPGPVHLSVPEDLLREEFSVQSSGFREERKPVGNESGEPPMSEPSAAAELDEVRALLEEAERPVILAGPAMARGDGWKVVEALSAATSVPALPMLSPRGVNDPSLHDAVNSVTTADVVLLLGKKLDFSLRFGQTPPFDAGRRFIQVDADEEELRPSISGVTVIHGDPVDFAMCLAEVHTSSSHWTWRNQVEAAKQAVPASWAAIRSGTSHPIHPLRVAEAVQPFVDAGAIFVSDGGEFGQWAQAGISAETRLINGPSGAIGSAIPLAIGAKRTCPDRPVTAFVGDGTFGYHGMELDTAIRYDLPIVVVVGNDARWNAEHQIQINAYGPDRLLGCDLLPSRYDRVAQALGGFGAFVEDAEELVPAVEAAIASGLAACVNVAIDGVAAPSLLNV